MSVWSKICSQREYRRSKAGRRWPEQLRIIIWLLWIEAACYISDCETNFTIGDYARWFGWFHLDGRNVAGLDFSRYIRQWESSGRSRFIILLSRMSQCDLHINLVGHIAVLFPLSLNSSLIVIKCYSLFYVVFPLHVDHPLSIHLALSINHPSLLIIILY